MITFQIDGSVTSNSDCGTRNDILSQTLPATTGKKGEGEMREGATMYYHIESSCIRIVSMALMS
jgi:hypothetical protein